MAWFSEVRDRPILGDGLGLLATDPATVPFRGHFEYRWKVYTDLRKTIQAAHPPKT